MEKLLIIFNGESNAGGLGANAHLTAAEVAPRPETLILNNDTLVFESLNIPENNNIGHAALAGPLHGWENGIANGILNHCFGPSFDDVYLIKTGQGGSVINDWDVGDSYWNTFLTRVNAGLALLAAYDLRVVVYYSLGINNVTAGTPYATIKAGINDILDRIKVATGCELIVMTRFMVGYEDLSAMVQEMDDERDDVESVSGLASLRDSKHWDKWGLIQLADEMNWKTAVHMGWITPGSISGVSPVRRIGWAGKSQMWAPQDGELVLFNNTETGF